MAISTKTTTSGFPSIAHPQKRGMGHCKDCKFWGGTAEWTEKNGFRECRGVQDIENVPLFEEPPSEWMAYKASYDGAGLLTQPDFGCVLFEAKEGHDGA